jgi:hypothetical protein
MAIVEFEIEMVRLEIDKAQDAWHGPGKFPKTVQGVLSLACHALLEFFAVDFGTAPHSRRVPEGACCFGMIRATWAKFPLDQSIHSSSHVGKQVAAPKIPGRPVKPEWPATEIATAPRTE